MKIAEALGQIQSSQPKMKLRDALMQVNPAYARAKKAEEARIVAEKTKAEAQKYEENARFWETIAHPSGALKSVGTEIVGTTKAVGADLVNVLTPWNQNKISDVQFGGKTFQTPSAKGAEAGTLARQGEYKKAAGKLGEAALDIISTVTPASITIKALKAGSILRAFLGGGLATAPIGAGYGATGAMQEGAGTGDILKQSAKGAGIAFVGGGVLGSIPGITKALPKIIPKIEEVIGKLTTKEVKVLETELKIGKTPEQAIDTVLQSRPLESVKKTDAQVKETVSEPKTEVKPTKEDPLIQEARKYKSAEEFVKAQEGGRFHGTSREIEKLSDGDSMYSPQNIYGQGFYTTDNLSVAEGYMKKGKGGEPGVYKVSDKNNTSLYDIEKPMPADLLEDVNKFDIADYVPWKEGQSLREVYDDIRELSASGEFSADVAQEYFDSLRTMLESRGFRGIEHIGGGLTAGKSHVVKIYWYPEKDLSVTKSVTKSQLTDIWNRAQEKPIDTSLPEQPKPDVTPKKESGYAKSLETKAVEKKMASEFQDLAEYTPSVRKEQAQMTTKLINEDIEKVNSILDGKSELPSGMRGSSLALAVEQHAIANNDVKLLQKLAKSKIASGISEAGSELSMLAGRNANSPVRIIRNIIKARKENVVKRLKGKKVSEARKVTKESIKKAIKKEAPTKETWSNFIKEIKC